MEEDLIEELMFLVIKKCILSRVPLAFARGVMFLLGWVSASSRRALGKLRGGRAEKRRRPAIARCVVGRREGR